MSTVTTNERMAQLEEFQILLESNTTKQLLRLEPENVESLMLRLRILINLIVSEKHKLKLENYQRLVDFFRDLKGVIDDFYSDSCSGSRT